MRRSQIQQLLGRSYRVDVRVAHGRVDPVPPPADPIPPPPDAATEALTRAQYEAEAARAERDRIKRQLEEIQRQLPSEEQRARWADLEAQHTQAEELRRRKEGEFDSWRTQIAEKHQKELDTERSNSANAAAQAAANERELNDTLIGLAFSGASDWFGPTGKTVLLPSVAQAYFASHVEVEVVPNPTGGRPSRRVVVKDHNGAVIVDTKTGKPLPFDKAIGELVEAHPQKNYLLRGSGKVGSGSAGGNNSGTDIDLTRLRAADFQDPNVRDRVRASLQAPGGLKVGPGFDQLRKTKERT